MRKIEKMRHGKSKHPLYHTWQNILRRCNKENHSRYKDYGGRGIKMQENWEKSPTDFIDYVESLPRYEEKAELNLSLDRIDNNLGYVQGNLKWSTMGEQSDNKRNANSLAFKGVLFDKHKGQWKALNWCTNSRCLIFIGYFNSATEATEAVANYGKK